MTHFPPARSQPNNSTLPASSAIHLLRPSLFPLRPPFTSFGRASSGFARHSLPSAAPLPASPFIPGLTGNLLFRCGCSLRFIYSDQWFTQSFRKLRKRGNREIGKASCPACNLGFIASDLLCQFSLRHSFALQDFGNAVNEGTRPFHLQPDSR